jgi:excisionase family DNA binding protein
MHSPEELAERFGVTRRLLLDWMREHDWPHVKVGRVIRFTDEQVSEILRRQTVAAKSELPRVQIGGQTKRSARRSA